MHGLMILKWAPIDEKLNFTYDKVLFQVFQVFLECLEYILYRGATQPRFHFFGARRRKML